MQRIARFGMVCLAVVMLVLVGAQVINVSPALAATIDNLSATCRFVLVSGKTEVNTSYVRVQVVLATDLNTVLAQQVVRTRPRAGSTYRALLDIRRAHLTQGTRVIISAGEWDGIRYLRPATLTGVDCNRDGGSTQPTPAPTSTLPQETWPPPTPIDQTPAPTPTQTTVSQTPPPTPTQPPLDTPAPTPTPG